MTKDRPRNRPGNAGKPGHFRGPGGPKGQNRDRDGDRSRGPGESGGEKPWTRDRGPGKPGPHKSGQGSRPGHSPRQDRREPSFEEHGETWIWGFHAASAALANPRRRIGKAYMSRNAAVRAGLAS